MSTKRAGFSMPTRPAPTPEEIAKADAFVAGAGGSTPAPEEAATVAPPPEAVAETQNPAKATSVTAAPAPKTARLTIDLPDDLHHRFKLACTAKRTKMVIEVTKFIESWTQKNS
ncbi:hypothetical protein [Acidisoma silvae]|uniref:Uncharacterized protein n=1 Tax=Acidisoma silvae TaxID=2802396 RepID=A0A963YY99_9PROT|nr:hypothetical protein [Acidisoma silvae]MCB8878438.1 hypothetical protein [Acidisoma silvae]